MMKSLFLFFSLLFYSLTTLTAQPPKEAEAYLQLLEKAKDSIYVQIILEIDQYLEKDPENVHVRIEKCKLINQAFYDYYDDYNPKAEEFDECVQSLVAQFPNNQEVLLYWLDQAWGDSSIAIANQILDMNRAAPGSWSDEDLSGVYHTLAIQYQYNGTPDDVIESASLAQTLNDSLDLTYLLAQQYIEKQSYEQAGELLLENADSTDAAYALRDKAYLLMEIGMHEEASRLFSYAKRDTTIYLDHARVAEALMNSKRYEEARAHLIKELEDSYDKSTALHSLFDFDYHHSPKDTVLATYQKLMDDDFHNDTFGKYRFMMMAKAPFQGWKFNDLGKFFFFLLLMALVIVLPYLLILPIHFISQRFGISNSSTALRESRWGLTDLWLILSGALIIEVLAWVIFNYEDLLATFFSDIYVEIPSLISEHSANLTLFYFSAILIMTLGYLRKEDFYLLTSRQWKVGKSIGLAFLFSYLFRAAYFFLVREGILPGVEISVVGSIIDDLKSINQFYHPFVTFLFSVFLVPFYEEYIFRGIMLNSLDSRVKFIAANIIQSALFALVHDNLSLFLFYFLFGIIAGQLVKKSNSLLPAFVFHATNNLFAFIGLMRL